MPTIGRGMVFAALLALAHAAPAQDTDWTHAPRVEIDLSSFKYTPATIPLRHGQPYVLVFVNKADGGHDLVAQRFFAVARVADPAKIAKGEVELGGGETAEVRLIAPPAGTYDVHCSHFMHSTFGMKASIVVQ